MGFTQGCYLAFAFEKDHLGVHITYYNYDFVVPLQRQFFLWSRVIAFLKYNLFIIQTKSRL